MTTINHNDDKNNDGVLYKLTVYPPSIHSSFLPSFLFTASSLPERLCTAWRYPPRPHVSEALRKETSTRTAACCCRKLHHGLSLFPVDWGQLQGRQPVCSWENAANWERSRLSLRHEHGMKVFRICTVNICCVKKHELSPKTCTEPDVQNHTTKQADGYKSTFSPSVLACSGEGVMGRADIFRRRQGEGSCDAVRRSQKVLFSPQCSAL